MEAIAARGTHRPGGSLLDSQSLDAYIAPRYSPGTERPAFLGKPSLMTQQREERFFYDRVE